MKLNSILIFILLPIIAFAGNIPFERVPADRYLSFVMNWDDARDPVLYTVMDSDKDWDKVFHPAPLMGAKKPFGPMAKEWRESTYLVITRVMPSPKAGEDAFTIESLEESPDGTLTIRYHYKIPQPASYTIKNALLIKIPKKSYNRIVWIENGKRVGELTPPSKTLHPIH